MIGVLRFSDGKLPCEWQASFLACPPADDRDLLLETLKLRKAAQDDSRHDRMSTGALQFPNPFWSGSIGVQNPQFPATFS